MAWNSQNRPGWLASEFRHPLVSVFSALGSQACSTTECKTSEKEDHVTVSGHGAIKLENTGKSQRDLVNLGTKMFVSVYSVLSLYQAQVLQERKTGIGSTHHGETF